MMNSATSSKIEFLSSPKPNDFAEEWYDSAGDQHFWMQWRLRAFLRMAKALDVPLDAAWNVLDIGGGNGTFSRQVESQSNWTVHTADLNQRALELVPPGRGKALYYDILEPRKEYLGRFDAILLFDVIEHLEPTQEFIKAAIQHLKPGGYLFVNVPALQTLYSHYDKLVGHHRRYNRLTLAQEFTDQPIEIIEQRYWGFGLLPIALLRQWLLAVVAPNREGTVNLGFKPPSQWINALFNFWSRWETALLRRPLLGTSLLLVGKKK